MTKQNGVVLRQQQVGITRRAGVFSTFFLHAASIVLCSVPGLAGSASAALVLVEKTQPRSVIVIANDASDQTREAAKLLQDYIGRISGARLEIQEEREAATGTQILVGRSQRAKALGVEIRSRLTSHMNEEEYIIKTVGNSVVLDRKS